MEKLSKTKFYRECRKFQTWNTYSGGTSTRIEIGTYTFDRSITTKKAAWNLYKDNHQRINAYAFWTSEDYGKWWNGLSLVVRRELFDRHAPQWVKDQGLSLNASVDFGMARHIWNYHIPQIEI